MGTLRVPDVVPSPTQDSERLWKAFEGWGADKKAIIWILGHRNADQRRQIRDTYQLLYNESLVDRLNNELSGDLKKALVLWACDPPERDAKLAKEALETKKGTKHLDVIIEIACASSPNHLVAVRQAYCSLYDCSLEEDIMSSVSFPLRKLLVGLVSSYRYDRDKVDIEVANLEATKLRGAIEMKQLDQDHVVRILGTRNFYQLRSTFVCYKQKYGTPIDEDIKNCGTGDCEGILKLVIWCIDSPKKHFAEVVRAATVGLGTDENSLTRAIITRAEIDMTDIKEEYVNANKTTINDAVIGDTSGFYKEFLLTLLGANF